MALTHSDSLASREYAGLHPQDAHFRQDPAWMQRLVLVAKHTVVWLAQLSQRFGRPITRLDQIPDEALQELADRGFTGLWLVGLWQRSPASRKIKRLTGQEHADASAYAITAYRTAAHLGGEPALDELRRRAARFGIRLAADMVPNHTGMDAPWMADHPQRYISTPEMPIPQYTFTGPNLSGDPRLELYLEDHYLDRSDAAVVFKRVDARSGEVRYVYHGNDGVGTPWNDTAQLDFLRSDVREAVTEQILDVARRFPILRFDAAMALAKQHIRRLWHPQEGDQGYVETRQHHGLSPQDFEVRIPQEFWRQLVERVERELPDTLLMAEAFWLTEGYFAHSLGMHRVYNSAFMHSLSTEANASFREGLQSALAFDPRILPRFVNFMSTPDEESALARFGKGDKYFGVATLLATLPGLPMFAHGQVEGLGEKYAMDFARPRLDEKPDQALIARHARQILPLLQRRELFAGVENFRLYEPLTADSALVDDVIAFSNRAGKQRALVLYNNSPVEQSGLLRLSLPFRNQKGLIEEDLPKALALDAAEHWRAEEFSSGKKAEWHTSTLRENGLAVSLQPYEVKVYWNFTALN